VLAFDDLTALGVVRGLLGAGLRVPEDCSVVGFDDVLPAAVATPGITTIRQPLREMGLLAADWVVGGDQGARVAARAEAAFASGSAGAGGADVLRCAGPQEKANGREA